MQRFSGITKPIAVWQSAVNQTGFAFSLPDFTLPCNSDTGGASFLGMWVLRLLSVPCGSFGSGLLMPALAILSPHKQYPPGRAVYTVFSSVSLAFNSSVTASICTAFIGSPYKNTFTK